MSREQLTRPPAKANEAREPGAEGGEIAAQWYLSVFDRATEKLVLERALHGVTDERVRSTFQAERDALGGFKVEPQHLAFVERCTNARIDLEKQIAFVEFAEGSEKG